MTITEFLLARIAEDEYGAKLASFGWGAAWKSVADYEDEWYTIKAEGKREVVGGEDSDVIAHIARHDPARVLAECAAKRAIVEQHREFLYTDDEPGFSMVMWDCMCQRLTGKPCPTIGSLASVYADHPDYDPEWRL